MNKFKLVFLIKKKKKQPFIEDMDHSQNPCEVLGMKLRKWIKNRWVFKQSRTVQIGAQIQSGVPSTAQATRHWTEEQSFLSSSGSCITPPTLLPLLPGPWTVWILLLLPS